MPVSSSSKGIFALLGAAILSLACTIVGMFAARAHLVEANEWVRHTSEVADRLMYADKRERRRLGA